MSCRTFFSPDKARYVLFTESVLQHMYGYAQRARHQAEAGGEIFSPLPYSAGLLVDAIAGPHPGDHRSRNACNPDVQATTQARNIQYEHGRHAIGLWHTPSPGPARLGGTEELRKTIFEHLGGTASDI